MKMIIMIIQVSFQPGSWKLQVLQLSILTSLTLLGQLNNLKIFLIFEFEVFKTLPS